MQVPLRLLRALRPSEHPGLLLATAFSTAALSVPPFLLPALAEAYGIGLALASLTTAAQLAGFVMGSWGSGRFLRPRGRVLGIALIASIVCDLASALLPPLSVLIALRVLSGVGIGTMTWFAWAQVFGDDARVGQIAVIGPVVGITTAPVAAELIGRFGPEGVFVALGLTALVPLAVSRRSGSSDPALLARPRSQPREDATRHRPTPAASWILLWLGVLTMGGSAVFTYGAVIAIDTTRLSLNGVALAYSANALASIPSARWSGRRGPAGLWVVACAVSAVVMCASANGVAFVAAIVVWGFAFWMGVPAAYSLLARCSRHPAERAGDAQAIMAAGRVVGPLAGGVLLDTTSATALGLAGGALMTIAGIGLFQVDRAAVAAPDPE